MSEFAGAPKITSLADLFAVAYQIEADAVERYNVLADQMETHNNPELVAVFRDLARAEAIHRDEILRLAGDIDVVAHARRMAKWKRGESPEESDLGSAHYLMTPWHALQLALPGEDIKRMATEFMEEETEHVNLVHRLLKKYPAPPASWPQESDPPVSQE